MHKNFLLLVVCVIATIMMLGIFGLMACSGSLDDYKVEGKAAIDVHFATKTQSDYTTENWALIQTAVTDGKAVVDAATSKSAVDVAVESAKEAINEVRKEGIGVFYTLQEAYDEELLTVEDLQNIASCHTNTTYSIEELSSEISEKILNDYFIKIKNDDIKLDAVYVDGYCGTYNGCVAVVIAITGFEPPASIDEVVIEGVEFSFNTGRHITIWKAL